MKNCESAQYWVPAQNRSPNGNKVGDMSWMQRYGCTTLFAKNNRFKKSINYGFPIRYTTEVALWRSVT